jgi:hypothetical protein
MAIHFSCECGKKLQAKDEFAGRRMKCPKCAQVLTIPRVSGVAPNPTKPLAQPRPTKTMPAPSRPLASKPLAPKPPPAPTPPPSPGFVRFVCSCGRKMKAREKDAGSAIDCPTCGRELVIPRHDTEVAPEPKFGPVPVTAPATTRQKAAPPTSRQLPVPGPARAPSSRLNHDPVARVAPRAAADGLFTQSVTPWRGPEEQRLSGKPPKEKPIRRLWLAFMLVLLLPAALLAACYLGPQAAPAPVVRNDDALDLDLAVVPGNAEFVATVRVAKSGPPVDKSQGAGTPLYRFAATLATPLQLWPKDDIDRLTVAVVQVTRLPDLQPVGPPVVPGGGDKKGKGGPKKGVNDAGGGPKKGPPDVGGDPKKGPLAPEIHPEALYIVRTMKPFRQETALSILEMGQWDSVPVAGQRKMIVSRTANDKAVYFFDSNVFVVGTPDLVKNLVKATRQRAGEKHPLHEALKVARHHDLVIAENSLAQVKPQPGAPSFMWFAVDEVMEGNTPGLQAHGTFAYTTTEEAKQVKPNLDSLFEPLKFARYQSEVRGEQLVVEIQAKGESAQAGWKMLSSALNQVPPAPWTAAQAQKGR